MKKLLLAVAPLALLVAVPALAADARAPFAPPPPPPAPLFGVVLEGWAGWSMIGGDYTSVYVNDQNFGAFGGSARAGAALGNQLSLQLDLLGEGSSNGGNDGNIYFKDSLVGGGHISWRNNDGLVGAFGGVASSRATFISAPDRMTAWFAGIEGQAYLGDITFYAQAGYFDAKPYKWTFHEAGFGRILGRYFFAPNTSIQAEASLLYGQQDDAANTVQSGRAVGWGVRLDHQLPIYPGASTGLFAAYRGGLFESFDDPFAGDNHRIVDHTLLGGIRVGFGTAGTDLKTNDRRGINLDLPDVGRWTSGGYLTD